MEKDSNFINLHNNSLLKALANRKAYFDSLSPAKRKEAYKFQEIIDNELAKAGNQANRMSVIQRLMREQLLELQKQTSSLAVSLKELGENIHSLKPETFEH